MNEFNSSRGLIERLARKFFQGFFLNLYGENIETAART